MKYNICWECGNACANKCDYVRLGRAIKGWTVKRERGRQFIAKCPNFVFDGFVGVTAIADTLGISRYRVDNLLRDKKDYCLVEIAREKGYLYSIYRNDDSDHIHILLPLNAKRGIDDTNESL